MKLVPGVLRSVNVGLSHQFRLPQIVRAFSTNPPPGNDDGQRANSFESTDDFERRIFGDFSGDGSKSNSFYQKLDRIEKAHDRSGLGSKFNVGNRSEYLDGLDESFNTLSDGMDGKLKKAATYFEYDPMEIAKPDYSFRPDMTFWPGNTYDTKDLDLTKPAVRKPFKRNEFEVTSEEVLKKADFRPWAAATVNALCLYKAVCYAIDFSNKLPALTLDKSMLNVRFLANFITEAGIIIKRSQTRISAKAQRKVAREIKTARAFGLMPFTTMGTKHFMFGKTMENLDEDFEYYSHDFVDTEENQDPPLGA